MENKINRVKSTEVIKSNFFDSEENDGGNEELNANTAFRKTAANFKGNRERNSKDIEKPLQREGFTNEAGLDINICRFLEDTKELLDSLQLKFAFPEVEKIRKSMSTSFFTVSVVGEFSRGKSTFLNNLLEEDFLPVGNLPTTAMLTRVTYGENPRILHVKPDGKKAAYPICEQTWNSLTAKFEGSDPQGVLYVGIKNDWVRENKLQFIDTPGVGDLSDARTGLVNDALLSSDGSIIAVSALAALSMTERTFIEQRILARKIPHLMIILTRLDQVNPEDRIRVIRLVKDKLENWNVDIPVFIPGDMEIPGAEGLANVGMESIKNEIQSWLADSNHSFLRMRSSCTQILNLLDLAEKNVKDQFNVISMNENEKASAVRQQRDKLYDIRLRWEELRLNMMKRSDSCYKRLRKEVEEKQFTIVEKLQFELSHTNNPKNWWDNDYPYRLKMEMTHLASSLENGLNQIFVNDVRWLNDTLMKEFHTNVNVEKEGSFDKEDYPDASSVTSPDLEDLTRLRTISRVGTGAATILGYILLGPFGSAISISGGILTEMNMTKNMEKQKEKLSEAVSKDIPLVIDKASAIMEKRLTRLYDRVIEEARNQEEIWARGQMDAINKAAADKDNTKKAFLESKASELSNLKNRIMKFVNVGV